MGELSDEIRGDAGDGAESDDLYRSLRELARRALSRTPVLLEPTDLVHEAWLRIAHKYRDRPRWEFLALCATVIRRVAVDEARRVGSRPAEGARVSLGGVASESLGDQVDLLQLDEALDALRETDERWARIVELRFFGGLSGDEVADALGISRRTAVREWALARAWLKRRLAE